MTASTIARLAGTEVQARLPGVLNAIISTPDIPAFLMTDYDVSWFGSVDDIADTDQALIGHWSTVGNQRSWSMRYDAVSGHPTPTLWHSGTGSTSFSNDHSPRMLVRPGQFFGLRATRRTSDAVCKIYFSPTDPPNWELLATTICGAVGQAPFDSTVAMMIGGVGAAAGTASFHKGYFRRAEIRNGFDGAGTVIASPNVTGLTLGATSFVDAQGNTWTLGGTTALAGRSLSAEPYRDEWVGDKRVWPLKDGYVNHGVAAGGNYSVVATPAIAAYTTTDLDVRWFGAIDWTRSGGIFDQWDVAGNQRAWLMEMGGGQTRLSFSTTGANQFMTPLVTFPFGVGQPGGVRFTRVQSTGLVQLWFSTDGINWTVQASGNATVAAATAMFASTAALMFGAYNTNGSAGQIVGVTHYAELRNGINGPVVFRHGPQSLRGLGRKQASWTCETGQTVTRAGGVSPGPWVYPTVDVDDILDTYKGDVRTWPGGDGYVSFPGQGIGGNYISTPSYPAIDVDLVPGFTLVARIRRHGATWTPQVMIHKQSTYVFDIDVDGWGGTAMVPRLFYDYNNHANWAWHFGDPMPDTNGWVLIAFTYRATNGAGSYEMRFLISLDDGMSWQQSGPTRTGVDTMVISTAPTNPLNLGANVSGGIWSNMDMAYASIRQGTGALGTVGGIEVFRLDPDSFKVGRRTTTVPAVVQTTAPKSFTNYAGVITTPDTGVPPDQFILIAELTAGPNGSGGTIKTIASHGPTTPNYAWRWVWVENSVTAKTVRVVLSGDGTAVTNFSVANIVPHARGKHYYLAQSMEKVGANWTTIVYESEDGVVWSNRGTSTVAFGTIFDTAADLRIGDTSGPHLPEIHSMEMRTGLNPAAGTILWKFAAAENALVATYRQPGIVDSNGDGIADDWTTWQVGTVSNTIREVADGLQYVEAMLGSNPAYFGIRSPKIPVTNGTTYAVSTLWYLTQTASACNFSVRAYGYNAAGVYLTEFSCINISGGGATTPSDVQGTFIASYPGIASVEILMGIGLSNVAAPGITRAGFGGLRMGPASSYVDPRSRTWSVTNAGGAGSNIAYEPRDLTVNRSGTPALQIYPSVIPNTARWDESQWDDGTDWA